MIKADMVAGEAFGVDFEITLNNAPSSIVGFAAKIELRDTSNEGKVIGSWDDSSPAITRDDANGILSFNIPASVTNQYKFNTAYMDLLLLKAPDGRRSATLQISFVRGVTR